MRSRDENAGDAFVALLARWTDPAGFESVRLQEQAKGTDEVVEGSATVTALDIQLRHDGTPLTTPEAPTTTTGPATTTGPPTTATEEG